MPAKENNIVKRTPELSEPSQLNAGQKLRLGAVLPMPDEQIDYSDAPVLPDTVWMKAAEQLPHTRKQIMLRVDAEVLEFFRHTGRGISPA